MRNPLDLDLIINDDAMVITRKIIVGICIVCAVGTSHSSMAQKSGSNSTYSRYGSGRRKVTMLVTQETTTRYRRTTSRSAGS